MATSTITASLLRDGATFRVETGDGASFPSVPFVAYIWPAGEAQTVLNTEWVLVTVRDVDRFTATRGYGTPERVIAIGDQVSTILTAGAGTVDDAFFLGGV